MQTALSWRMGFILSVCNGKGRQKQYLSAFL
nr:MAG TPA: Ribulose bisphosphate carboxylase large chain finger, assembly chaperone, assembly [Caudoviricetes sp.]